MIHLLRTAVGSKDLQQLHDIHSHFKLRKHKSMGPVVVLTTRNMPKRADELESGGSVYWIVKNIIQARQKIYAVESVTDSDGERMCQILIDPKIMRVMPQKHRAVQGWRYLDPAKAPRDLGVFANGDDETPPEDLARELKAMGLL